MLIEAHFAVEGWGDHVAHDLELAGFGLGEDDVQQWLDEFGGRKLNRLARKVEALIYETTIIEDLRAARPLPPDALRSLDLPVHGRSTASTPTPSSGPATSRRCCRGWR